MIWNWQRPDWPHFAWDATRLVKAEEQFLLEAGEFVGTVKHLGPDDREHLTVEAMSTEALTTSEIEGDVLDQASVQSSIRKQLGLAAEKLLVGSSWSRPGTANVSERPESLHCKKPERIPCELPQSSRARAPHRNLPHHFCVLRIASPRRTRKRRSEPSPVQRSLP